MEQRVVVSYVTEFEDYVKTHKAVIWQGAFSKYNRIYKKLKDSCNGKLTKKKIEESVFSMASDLEETIKEIVEKHSTLFWLQIYRKVDPDAFNGIPEQIKPTTIYLILRTVDCFIIKYGKKERTDVMMINKNTLTPIYDVTYSGYEMGIIFYLCCLYYNLTALHRCISKGCKVSLGENDFETSIDEETEYLMRLIDIRYDKYGNPIHNLCTSEYSRNQQFRLKNLDEKNMSKMIFESRAVNRELSDYPYNFIISPFFIEDVIKYTRFWTDMNIFVNGFTPNELIVLIASLTRSRLDFCNNRIAFILSFCTNGYIIIYRKKEDTPPKQYIHDGIQNYFSGYYELIHGQAITKKNENTLINRFISNYSNCNSIQPFSRTRLPIFIECGDTIVINLVNILDDLVSWTSCLNESQEVSVGANRGQLFQEEVRRVLSRNMDGSMRFYPESSERVYLNEKLCGEIDIGIKKNNILYVIECKHKLSYTDNIVETIDYVKKMNALQKAWLKQVDTLVNNLRNGAVLKDGTQLCDDKIKYIVPLVCTAVPYYTKSSDNAYYIAKDIPRVLTPQELVIVIQKPIEELLLPA